MTHWKCLTTISRARTKRWLAGVPARQRGVDHAVVEALEREVGLRDGEVLVVALVRDDRLVVAREVEALLGRDAADGLGLAHLEVAVVLVELRRAGVGGALAVERVQVQRGRAALDQVRRGDVGPERDRRLVEGQVVVDELAEVGEAGGDLAEAAAALGHREGELLARGVAELGALRHHAREAERRRGGRCEGDRGGRAGAVLVRLAEQALTDDEVRLGAVHGASLSPSEARGQRLQTAPANTSSGSRALTMYWPASTISEIRRSTHRLASRYASSRESP